MYRWPWLRWIAQTRDFLLSFVQNFLSDEPTVFLSVLRSDLPTVFEIHLLTIFVTLTACQQIAIIWLKSCSMSCIVGLRRFVERTHFAALQVCCVINLRTTAGAASIKWLERVSIWLVTAALVIWHRQFSRLETARVEIKSAANVVLRSPERFDRCHVRDELGVALTRRPSASSLDIVALEPFLRYCVVIFLVKVTFLFVVDF